jgi:hypothetical protein
MGSEMPERCRWVGGGRAVSTEQLVALMAGQVGRTMAGRTVVHCERLQ